MDVVGAMLQVAEAEALEEGTRHLAIEFVVALIVFSRATRPDLQQWTEMAESYDNLTESVRIAMVGKYVGLTDSYLSVVKALLHACVARSLKPSINWIAASDLEDDSQSYDIPPPKGESLEMCSQRAVVYFKDFIEP
ncbi:hypothetical protein RJT34_02277 [Clitoria ternatea]|uniref:Uncharacterized protein n=1 Tax=Clitoria ternatea TaxID=43366 RepID=A0AAN9KHL6_CLITE